VVFHVGQLRGQFKGSPLKLSGGGARLDDVSLIVRGPELQVGIWALVILTGGYKWVQDTGYFCDSLIP
jgi:hypothetical protein